MQTGNFADRHPNVRGAQKRLTTAARVAADSVPDAVSATGKQILVTSLDAAERTVARVSRAGLTPERVVAKHQGREHPVEVLSDLRDLDLELVDKIRSRYTDLAYSALAGAAGATTGLMISGGELAIPVSGGAAAAPGFGAIVGTLAADAAVVTGLASRAVGSIALLYGYDPEDPAEKLFNLAVINAGTALTAAGKAAAMAELSMVTQALFRGATWAVLDKTVIAQLYKRASTAFAIRFTKKGLGKFVPVAGIAIGGVLNFATLDGISDAANVAYRRRFLLEKYPHLNTPGTLVPYDEVVADEDEGTDDVFSVLAELEDLGVDMTEPANGVDDLGPALA